MMIPSVVEEDEESRNGPDWFGRNVAWYPYPFGVIPWKRHEANEKLLLHIVMKTLFCKDVSPFNRGRMHIGVYNIYFLNVSDVQ